MEIWRVNELHVLNNQMENEGLTFEFKYLWAVKADQCGEGTSVPHVLGEILHDRYWYRLPGSTVTHYSNLEYTKSCL